MGRSGVAGAVTFGYLVGYGLFLERRRRQTGIAAYRAWAILVASVNLPALVFAAIAAATGAVWAIEIMVVVPVGSPDGCLLARVVHLRWPAAGLIAGALGARPGSRARERAVNARATR